MVKINNIIEIFVANIKFDLLIIPLAQTILVSRAVRKFCYERKEAMRLANLTWPKAQEYFVKNDMVLISIGSIECHGRHMPLGTDTLIPEYLLEKIEKKSDVLIAPTIPYGSWQSLAPYPGTIDIDNEVLYQFCRQVFLSLYRHGARKFVFLNGHGGNIKMIERLGMEFEDKGCLVAMLNWWLMAWDMNPAWKGGHGGGEETAAILGIDPPLGQ